MEKESEQYLFEEMPVPRAVAALAIPTIISQAVTMIYNLATPFHRPNGRPRHGGGRFAGYVFPSLSHPEEKQS